MKGYREGLVYYWPQKVQKQDLPPLPVRLLRLRGDKADVWLITNVLDEHRLPRQHGRQILPLEVEKRGPVPRPTSGRSGKVKLMSRTVAQVHREAEGSLLATQLLLAQGALALPARPRARRCCPAPARCCWRSAPRSATSSGMYLGPRQTRTYFERLAQARWRDRRQRTSKVRRRWPGRKDHKPPGPPEDPQDGNHP